MKLKDKKAIVTGGSRGIGKAICIDLAKEGADVLINYHSNKEEANKTLDAVKKYSKNSFIFKADVSNESEVKKMVGSFIKKFRRVDILVNNAGIEIKSPLLELKTEDWNKVIGTNLNGCIYCSKYAALDMVKNKSGNIINISSIHDVFTYKNDAPYDISKAAIKMLTKSLALELSEYGITVNTVSPGAISTDMVAEALKGVSKKEKKRIINSIPLRRIGKAEEIAKVVSFLCSDGASYIDGTTIYVDGGFTVTSI
jgi:NAD(P)-dependent dehydrogenase (short-subunit alcohol dehydrogenase family)